MKKSILFYSKFKVYIYLFLFISFNSPTEIISQEWVYYNVDNGLPSDRVTAIAQDDDGNMWFAGNLGLSKFDGENMTVYTTEDGLAENNNYE